MSIENFSLDTDFVRKQFPSFQDSLSSKWSFFENAGGSYVPQTVINKLNRFMISTKVQPYASFDISRIAGEEMDKGIKFFSEMINARQDEIIIGSSTTMNMYVLSNALRYLFKKGDEIIVTNQDHEANIGAWRKLQEFGLIIKEWKINIHSGELQIDELKKMLNEKTKLLAVTHCSNIIGSINDLKKITKIAHDNNTLVIGDGVSYAPHGFPDVKELDVDFYTFSLYKTFGPHLGLLYGKKEIFDKLPNQNHEFLNNQVPYTLNPGGPNHEELACLVGIAEYFDDLYSHHFEKINLSRYERIKKINHLIAKHEENIGNLFLDFINSEKKIRLIGINKIKDKNRAPTFSFTIEGKSSKETSEMLIKENIALRNDNFYAWRCLKALDIDINDGVVRASMVHYNTLNDVKKLIKAFENSKILI